MQSTEKGICVRILDKEYRVACPQGAEEALKEAASYFDEQMRSIKKNSRVIGYDRLAVIAGLNISYKLLELEKDKLQTHVEGLGDRLKLMQNQIDEALEEPEKILRCKNNSKNAENFSEEFKNVDEKDIIEEKEV